MKCPYCAEDIKDEAIVCGRCRRDLTLFKPFEKRLQAIESDLAGLRECVSKISAFLDQKQTGETVEQQKTSELKDGETTPAPKLKKPTKWRMFLMVLLEFVLSLVLLTAFLLIGSDLQPQHESFYLSADEERPPSTSPIATAQPTPTTADKSQDRLQANSLCAKDERVVFSCGIEDSGKIASVCASKDLARDRGYLQYRFGLPGKIELEYPKDRKGTQEKFQYSHNRPSQLDPSDQTGIYFNIDGEEYEVFDTSVQGVLVGASDQSSQAIYCGTKASADYTDLESVLPANKSAYEEEAQRKARFYQDQNNEAKKFDQQTSLLLKILVATLFVLPIVLGLWIGLRWQGTNLKRYLQLGLLCGAFRGIIAAIILTFFLIWLRSAGKHYPGKFTLPLMFAALFVLIDLFRCLFGFATGGLLGDWIERRRHPQLYGRGFSDLMALKLSNRREQLGLFGRVTHGLGSFTSSFAPLVPLMGVIITSVLGFYTAQSAKKAKAESDAAKTATEQKDKGKADSKPDERALSPNFQPSGR